MASALENADGIIRPLIRGIDKRAEYSLALEQGDRPGVAVTLSLRKRTTTVRISSDDLSAAAENLLRRNQVRTAIKRALDLMLFEKIPLASTKMLRGDTSAEGFFRPPPGGARKRR